MLINSRNNCFKEYILKKKDKKKNIINIII